MSSLESKSHKSSQRFECNWVHDRWSPTPKELVIVVQASLKFLFVAKRSKRVSRNGSKTENRKRSSAGRELVLLDGKYEGLLKKGLNEIHK